MIKIGDKLRPRGGIHHGTLGFFCRRGDELFAATCDHVVRTLSSPESGRQTLYFDLGNDYAGPVAEFDGVSLTSASTRLADFALVRPLLDTPFPTALPQPIPETDIKRIRGAVPPRAGDNLFLWGAGSARYHAGVVLDAAGDHAWSHGKYGIMQYALQFSVALRSDYLPEVGDSGGYVVTPDGELVGLLAALSDVVSEAGDVVVHCVPALACCDALGCEVVTEGVMMAASAPLAE